MDLNRFSDELSALYKQFSIRVRVSLVDVYVEVWTTNHLSQLPNWQLAGPKKDQEKIFDIMIKDMRHYEANERVS